MSLAFPAPAAVPLAQLRRWIAQERAFGRFALWLPVCTAGGIMLAVAAPFDPSPMALGALLATLLALTAVTGRVAAVAVAAGPLLALSATAGGALLLALQAELRGTPLITETRTVTMTARVVADEARGQERTRLVLAPLDGNFGGERPRRVRVSVPAGGSWRAGETVRLTARLFPLRGPVLPGGFDAGRRLWFDGIGATGFSLGTPERIAPPPHLSLAGAIDGTRDAIEARITAVLGDGNAALANALLVGRRGTITEADNEALRLSGLGHILSISGLHMALVAGSVFAAVRFGLALVPAIALRYPIRKWAAVVGLAAATVYLALSGASVATMRSYVMLAIALVAILADRPALTIRTVAVAAVAVMAVDPVSVAEPSFQMSFLAVIALVGAYEWWAARRLRLGSRARRRTWWRPLAAFVIGLAATSVIAGFATAIAGAYHFHRVAPLGLLGNLAALPVLSFVAMPAGVLALVLMPLGLEGPPLMVTDLGLSAILVVAHTVADWTGEAGNVGAIPASTALLTTLGLLWLAIFTTPVRLAGAGFVAAGLALAALTPRYDLLVSDDGSTVAARGPDGRLTILGDVDGFAASVWLAADGDARAPGPEVAGGRCDPLGCTLPVGEKVVAVARSPRALLEDCALAAAVVSRDVIPACPAPLVIDRAALQRHGAHAAILGPKGWRVRVARPAGPVRAWELRSEVPR